MKYLMLTWLLLVSTSVYAQSYSGGLTIPGIPNSVGQKTMANSTSVTLASDQTAVPITGTITASNPSVGSNGSASPTSSTLIGYKDGNGDLQPFPGSSQGITVSATQGTSPWVSSIPSGVGITNSPTVQQGTSPWVVSVPNGVGITNTPNVVVSNSPTVLQGTSPWVSSIPSGVGITNTPTVLQGTSPWVTSIPNGVGITNTVTVSTPTASSSSITRASNNTSSATLASSNANRKGFFLYNDSTTNCYIKFGATASTTSFTVKMFSTDTYIMDPPVYTGVIDYICDAASGNMEVNEL